MGLRGVENVYVIVVALHYACDANMMRLAVVLLYTFGRYLPHDNLNSRNDKITNKIFSHFPNFLFTFAYLYSDIQYQYLMERLS